MLDSAPPPPPPPPSWIQLHWHAPSLQDRVANRKSSMWLKMELAFCFIIIIIKNFFYCSLCVHACVCPSALSQNCIQCLVLLIVNQILSMLRMPVCGCVLWSQNCCTVYFDRVHNHQIKTTNTGVAFFSGMWSPLVKGIIAKKKKKKKAD